MIGAAYPNQLRAWRERRKMTQQQLAERVGCSEASIGHWENGERRLTDKWLPKLADVLKVPQGYLLEVSPDDATDAVIGVWASIPEDARDQALKVLRAFAVTKKSA